MSVSSEFSPASSTATVGCFDSGLGGAIFLQHLMQLDPTLSFQFLADSAWMPYGEKPIEAIQSRVITLYEWFNQQFPNLPAFILACNTSVGAAYMQLCHLRDQHYPQQQLFNPIDAAQHWMNKHISSEARIVVLATQGTIASGSYQAALATNGFTQVTGIACPGWVDQIEAGHTDITRWPEIGSLIEQVHQMSPSVIVLGCTHYGLVQPALQQALPQVTHWVDSAQCLAQQVVSAHLFTANSTQHPDSSLWVTHDGHLFQQKLSQLGFSTLAQLPIKTISLAEPALA